MKYVCTSVEILCAEICNSIQVKIASLDKDPTDSSMLHILNLYRYVQCGPSMTSWSIYTLLLFWSIYRGVITILSKEKVYKAKFTLETNF